MPDLWMPGATRLDIGDHQPTDGGPAKAVAHITWDENGTASAPIDLVPYESLVNYFGRNSAGKAAAPHVLWDPFTGRVTQFVPATSRSKSLVDSAGGTRTNRAGSVVIQVEALFFPYCRVGGRVYARLADTPCAGWSALHDWIRSWGVPDTWPMGRPTNFNSSRSESVWESKAGWYAHAHVPENDHQDPGSWPDFTAQEEDMTPDQAAQLDKLYKTLVPYAGWSYKGEDAKSDAYGDMRNGSAAAVAASSKLDTLSKKLDGITSTGLTDAQLQAIADKVAANPALATAIATKVADQLAARLES